MRLILTAIILALTGGMAEADTAELSLSVRDSVLLPGTDVALTLTEVQDQRCPMNVDCYWEGMIRVVLAVREGGSDMQSAVLCNLCDDGNREAMVAGQRLTLARVEPDREEQVKLGRAPVLADYTAVVTVGP